MTSQSPHVKNILAQLWFKSFDNSIILRKTCDKVWHEQIEHKLQENGISGNFLNFLTNFLKTKNQRVVHKGCVRYICASVFCTFKGEHLQSKKKSFLFHFESSFCSWDNQILTSQIMVSLRLGSECIHTGRTKHKIMGLSFQNVVKWCV